MMISKISPTSAILLLREITISQAVVGLLIPRPASLPRSISPVNGSVFYYLGIDAGSNNQPLQRIGLDQYANMNADATNCWIRS